MSAPYFSATPPTDAAVADVLRRSGMSYHDEHRNYRQQELPVLYDLPAWRSAVQAANEDADTGKDTGTCVLGAGVCINVVPRHARRPRRFVLLAAPFQGNTGSAAALARAALILKDAGIDCYWYDGAMD